MATSLKRSKGSQSSLRIGTFSFWIKFTTSGDFNIYSNTVENDNNRGYLSFTSGSKYRMVDNDSSGTHIQLRTNRLFRDFNAWYHVVVRIDTTQSTNTDRVRLYVNGVQETSFDQTDYPSQNTDLKIFEGGQTNREYINNIYGGSASSPNFYLSHFHYADGQSYGPDTFGSTDSTTGEWKINVNPTVTYGNQGFFMFKDDASLNDDSGNGNNWTADTGTIQKSEDCPSNVFATLNPLSGSLSNNTLTDGNNTFQSTSGWRWRPSTICASSGKYYAEFKPTSSGNIYTAIGVTPQVSWDSIDGETIGAGSSSEAESVGYLHSGQVIKGNSTVYSGSTYTTNDIIGVALDLDNYKVYFRKNADAWENSGDPTSGATGTGAVSLSSTLSDWSISVSAAGSTISCNYGNGYFGTTAVSSAGTNASGNGIFEYDVPTGYTALSTKGLNT